MAWETYFISGLNTGTISNINGALAISGWQNNVPWENYMSDLGDNIADGVTQNTETDIWTNNEWRMTLTWSNNGNVAIKVYKNNVIFAELCSNGNLKAPCYIGFLINEDTQEGFCLTCALQYSRGYPAEASSGTNNLIYQFLKQNPVISYQWSSVPAISGKNGILSLTQILNINDGEPVENVTKKGNLDFSKKTKVNTLINSAYEPTYSEDETKATVEYEIPEAEYQYTKLVYKKKKIPKSASDGDAIDLNADATEIVVNNLDEDSKYYFKIFTDKTQSNSYKYSTGSNPLPEGKWLETVSTCKATDDSFSMSFTEDTDNYKINRPYAVDEWVWLDKLNGQTLTTSSVSVEDALSNFNLLTQESLTYGNNPIHYYNSGEAQHYERDWVLDDATVIHTQPNGQTSIGWDFRFSARFFGNYNWQYTTTENNYGCDFLVGVNHALMQAVFIWIRWGHHSGNPMSMAKQASSKSNTLYYGLSKFMS